MRKENIKEKGITLVALAITIIILLILAGITLTTALGQNGLFKRAKQAVEEYKSAEEKEKNELEVIEEELEELQSDIVLDGRWSEKNKVNMPKLDNTGLTPVVIKEGEINSEEGLEGTIKDNDNYGIENASKKEKIEETWYSYTEEDKRWANAQTKDGSMWVWIPRFAYKIKYNNEGNKTEGGTIKIVYLKNDTNEDKNGEDVTEENYKDEEGEVGAYIVHPAFKNGTENKYSNGEWDKEITGFWMAKFEAGYAGEQNKSDSATDSKVKYASIESYTRREIIGDDGAVWKAEKSDISNYYYGTRKTGDAIKYPVFQPNRLSYNYISNGEAYELCKNLTQGGNIYNLKNVDSHLVKNSEWGAVAYLSWSKYGTNKEEIKLNNVATNLNDIPYGATGYGASTTDATFIKCDIEDLLNGKVEGNWKSSQGQKASTTGNVYGVYDMSGGDTEFSASYVIPQEDESTYKFRTYLGTLLTENNAESTKYKNKYEGKNSDRDANFNESANVKRVGEALWETSTGKTNTPSCWNADNGTFITIWAPSMGRGCTWNDTSYAGIFAFYCMFGLGENIMTFRPVLIP